MTIMAEVHASIDDIGSDVWTTLAPPHNPFLHFPFLKQLEISRSIGPQETGWMPRYLELKEEGSTVALLPLYLKLDSYGEYIFDWAWARAAQQAGIRYYPKLVIAVPYTPATGERLLCRDSSDSEKLWTYALQALESIAQRMEVSSIHILFCQPHEAEYIGSRPGWDTRLTRQYHWKRRPEWETFDDYLGSMKSRHRKAVRRERRLIVEQGLTIRPVLGSELTDEHWKKLREFYLLTVHAKGGFPYLTESFFHQGGALHQHALAFFAYLNDTPIAGALCFQSGDHLYGRYWGTTLYSPSLHFELCYYAPIEWALQNGIQRYEAGAQGEHKIKRGFDPVSCYSAHHIVHPGLSHAVSDFLAQERAHTEDDILYLSKFSPFRTEDEEP